MTFDRLDIEKLTAHGGSANSVILPKDMLGDVYFIEFDIVFSRKSI